ncbi:MAG TPA: hypothetical protein VFZ19_09370 [Solirubrobacterales bacterium]
MIRLLVPILALALLAGCATAGEETAKPQKKPNNDPSRGLAEDRASEEVMPSRCPAGVAECREAEGRIVYVERVDPDGDGDAHFVIADSQSITLPGLTAIDVRKGLRPRPLPGPGDLISAAGPVQTGSYGQSQIHALELHVAR